MINYINYILLIILYLINVIYFIKCYQGDNYHFRCFKITLLNDIKKRWYIFFLILFIFIKFNIYINIVLSIYLIFLIIFNLVKNIKKIKLTNRIKRYFLIHCLIIIAILFIFNNIKTLIILNTFYLLICFVCSLISNFVEWLNNRKYIKNANKRIKEYNPFIIGITGSCGKTSIKHYLYEILKNEYITYKTPKSYNTVIGNNITINKYLNSYNNYFILEMGLAYKNDILKITKQFKPNISIITEILPSHLQTMKSIDAIVYEKMQIIKNMKENGIIIANYDNELIKNNICKYNVKNNKIIKIGLNNTNDYYCNKILVKIDGIEFELNDSVNNEQYYINSKLIGRHNIYNLLIVYAVLKELNISKDKIIPYLESLINFENRLEIKYYNSLTILNDSYNANINGFNNAMEVLSLFEGEKYIITPGIVETGVITKDVIFKMASQIIKICDFCYIIDNKNTKFFIDFFDKNNYTNYSIKKDFISAFNEVKNKKITLLIANDLTDFYLRK